MRSRLVLALRSARGADAPATVARSRRKSIFARAAGQASALALAAACALSVPAAKLSAATIDTYSFEQAGYMFSGDPNPGLLLGRFTGTVEPDGMIELSDLSSLHLTFFAEFAASDNGTPSFFSFDTNGGASTLDFVLGVLGGLGPGNSIASGSVCVGAVAAFGFGPCGPGGFNGTVGPVESPSGLYGTQDGAIVTLVSSVTTVPEASTWAMILLGFAGLAFLPRGKFERAHLAGPTGRLSLRASRVQP